MGGGPAGRERGTLVVTVCGFDMPGRSCGPPGVGEGYENVHVGVQRAQKAIGLVPGDMPEPAWSLPVTTRTSGQAGLDVGGPFVHGRPADRFLYLSWGVVDDGFRMFRRAKLHFADCDPEVLAAAAYGGELICRVRMSDECGQPRCARVRPPDATWTVPGAG